MTVSELISQLSKYPPNARINVLYIRESDQVWGYKVVNLSQDDLGVNLIIESARKLAKEGVNG